MTNKSVPSIYVKGTGGGPSNFQRPISEEDFQLIIKALQEGPSVWRVEPPIEEEPEHELIVSWLLDIGTSLGFVASDAREDANVAKGAVVDATWITRIANLGEIRYVFEVQMEGSVDYLLMNTAGRETDEAYGLYSNSLGKDLSSDEKQVIGEKIFQLCGDAVVKCLSEDMNAGFFNIWDSTLQTPQLFASTLKSNGTRNWGTILPYNVFDFSTAKRLYADAEPPRTDPPYCNEVKREYFWLEFVRKLLPSDTKMFIAMLGYDSKLRTWKFTVTTADSSSSLGNNPPIKELTELSFMIQKPDGSTDDWQNQTPIITNVKTDGRNKFPNSAIKAIYAFADKNYLYVMTAGAGRP